MAVAKGKWSPETGYVYTCGKCRGRGMVAGQPCPDCYGLDVVLIIEAFKLARGERYYALLKALLSLQGKAIYEAALVIIEESGNITVAQIFDLAVRFHWPIMRIKALFEWLEETNIIPSGSYRRLRDRGLKIKHAAATLGIVECETCGNPYYETRGCPTCK